MWMTLVLFLFRRTLSLEGDVELEVSYQPHFNTITKTGDANFSKIPHAVAELIDNSIQVRSGGTVVVSCHLKLSCVHSFKSAGNSKTCGGSRSLRYCRLSSKQPRMSDIAEQLNRVLDLRKQSAVKSIR